jgi:hypothetical protein
MTVEQLRAEHQVVALDARHPGGVGERRRCILRARRVARARQAEIARADFQQAETAGEHRRRSHAKKTGYRQGAAGAFHVAHGCLLRHTGRTLRDTSYGKLDG